MIRFLPAGALLAIAAFTGCAGWRTQAQPAAGDKVTSLRADDPELTQAFEERRTEAELLAAMDRWQHGDIAGCESRLRGLINRNPTALEPRLRLAELALACDQFADAEVHYRAALTQDAGRADIHHGLAIVLESQNRHAEARAHFERAFRLEPENELYRLSAEAAAPPGL